VQAQGNLLFSRLGCGRLQFGITKHAITNNT
jgi:hypothetical protein